MKLFEEIFPVVVFFCNRKKKLTKVDDLDREDPAVERYRELEIDTLNKRLKEEHLRAVKIDDKTSKFTLGLSVSLTIIAAVSGSFAKFLPSQDFEGVIFIVCGLSALCMLFAGIISLGAMKTLPTFGYGTEHEIELKKYGADHLAWVLLKQEEINIVRHLRNEAAYQSLRNGFLVLIIALIIALFYSLVAELIIFLLSVGF